MLLDTSGLYSYLDKDDLFYAPEEQAIIEGKKV